MLGAAWDAPLGPHLGMQQGSGVDSPVGEATPMVSLDATISGRFEKGVPYAHVEEGLMRRCPGQRLLQVCGSWRDQRGGKGRDYNNLSPFYTYLVGNHSVVPHDILYPL
jgi:hypothetical protein